MTVVVNDRRHVTPESPSVVDPLEKLRGTEPEKTFQIVVGAIQSYIRARVPSKKGKDGAAFSGGFTIPTPDHAVVDEIGRYVVEALLKSADARTWILIQAATMRTGDVFVAYRTIDGKPCDEELTVVSSKTQSSGKLRVVFRCRRTSGVYDEVTASPDYLFYVHRPTAESILAELDLEDVR